MGNLTGRQFEQLVLARAAEYRRQGMAHISRSGVQAVRTKSDWMVIQSLPDFEGVDNVGSQFIFDCKVCSQASFDLSKYRTDTKGARSRQLRHMMERSEYGVRCGFLLHWNVRTGKRQIQPAETFWFPVQWDLAFWEAFDRGEIRSITRQHCDDIAVRVDWTVIGRGRTSRPDFLTAIERTERDSDR